MISLFSQTCASGGPEGNTLYITSTRHALRLEVLSSAPSSGCLLQLQT